MRYWDYEVETDSIRLNRGFSRMRRIRADDWFAWCGLHSQIRCRTWDATNAQETRVPLLQKRVSNARSL